jgi:hypothetical protein
VFLVSRYGSATVRFTVRRTSHLTQVLQLRHSSLATTTVVAVATIVVVVAVVVAERTSNCNSKYYEEGMTEMPSLFCIFARRPILKTNCIKI